jgi:hypothetical protein
MKGGPTWMDPASSLLSLSERQRVNYQPLAANQLWT